MNAMVVLVRELAYSLVQIVMVDDTGCGKAVVYSMIHVVMVVVRRTFIAWYTLSWL